MRTFRLIGMTLLMVMLAVNFTACSDDEDEQTIIEQANLIRSEERRVGERV